MTKEWQTATNERAKEANLSKFLVILNRSSSQCHFVCHQIPSLVCVQSLLFRARLTSYTGIASEGYKGKGFVQSS